MLKGVLDYAKGLQSNVQYTKEFLNKLRGSRRRIVNAIEKTQQEVQTLKSPDKFVNSIKPELKKKVLEYAKEFLAAKAAEAMYTNSEFSYYQYSKPLLQAIKKDDTYKVRFIGSGWKTRISVDINLDFSAGRLSDWSRAIVQYRKELLEKTNQKRKKAGKSRIKGTDPIRASRSWESLYARRGGGKAAIKYRQTIDRRLELSGRLAPFWMILDKGSSVPMESTRGGYPTPKARATNFASLETERQINRKAIEYLKSYKGNIDDSFVDLNTLLDEARALLSEMDALLDELRLELSTIKRLEARLTKANAFVDSGKLSRAVQKIKSGLLTTGRVDITAKGSPKRVRPSVETIMELLDY